MPKYFFAGPKDGNHRQEWHYVTAKMRGIINMNPRRCETSQIMTEPKRTELSVQAERVLLVQVVLPQTVIDRLDPLGEIRSLTRTAGAQVVDEMLVRRQRVNPSLYVGTGKAVEIAQRVEAGGINTVIFDNDLSPAQIRDIERVVRAKVIDRSELILDIFAAHSQSFESRLQVELAQLEYAFPRLTHMWTHLERVAGGATTAVSAVGGIGTRGPGEKQIEIDRRLVQRRVHQLKHQIARIDDRRIRQVQSRKDVFSVCLVGYTNAGKSTLMHSLTGADVYIADKLFSTLDTRTHRWQLGDGEWALLSDTVGFVRDLPHHLVASFRATLEEAINADLLLHVADASCEHVDRQMSAVQQVLEELGCDSTRQLLVLNKVDRIKDPTVWTVLAGRYPRAVFVSAKSGFSLEELQKQVLDRVEGKCIRVKLRANCANGKLMSYIARHARVERERFADTTAHIQATMPARRVAQLRSFGRDVEVSDTAIT